LVVEEEEEEELRTDDTWHSDDITITQAGRWRRG